MHLTLLVDSEDFWNSLHKDILSSKKYIYLQTMSFEGDSIGLKLCDSLFSSNATDKKILVDPYIKVMISDKFLYSPKNRLDPKLRKEIKATSQMIKNLTKRGVQVKFSGSGGTIFKKVLLRDHKKLIVIDDQITYLGGLNFCDHNFQWHDMMLRIEDTAITKFLKQDFQTTWKGKSQTACERFDKIALHILDGKSNEKMFQSILNLIGAAKKSIHLESPYITFPFSEKLKEANKTGVEVVLITPEQNNKRFVKEYILWEFANSNVQLRLYKKNMSHLKAMLLDDEYLIVGSSNFDLISYRIQKEIIAIISDKNVIHEFKQKVFQNDLKNSNRFELNGTYRRGYLNNIWLRYLDRICAYHSKN